MKRLVYLCALVIAGVTFSSCSNSEKSEDKTEMVSYGPEEVDVEKAIQVAEMVTKMNASKKEQEFTINAKIDEVCSKAGCWINIKKEDGSTFKVIFEDHFTIPPKTNIGTSAYLHGIAYWDTIPVDILQHYAEDAGKSKEEIAKITEPSFELAFEADGITFEKAK
jgi:hypothetical protein